MISALIRIIMHLLDRTFRSSEQRENWNKFEKQHAQTEQHLQKNEPTKDRRLPVNDKPRNDGTHARQTDAGC